MHRCDTLIPYYKSIHYYNNIQRTMKRGKKLTRHQQFQRASWLPQIWENREIKELRSFIHKAVTEDRHIGYEYVFLVLSNLLLFYIFLFSSLQDCNHVSGSLKAIFAALPLVDVSLHYLIHYIEDILWLCPLLRLSVSQRYIVEYRCL